MKTPLEDVSLRPLKNEAACPARMKDLLEQARLRPLDSKAACPARVNVPTFEDRVNAPTEPCTRLADWPVRPSTPVEAVSWRALRSAAGWPVRLNTPVDDLGCRGAL